VRLRHVEACVPTFLEWVQVAGKFLHFLSASAELRRKRTLFGLVISDWHPVVIGQNVFVLYVKYLVKPEHRINKLILVDKANTTL